MKKQFQCKRVSELKFALTLLHLARKLSRRFKGVTFASAILWHPATGWDPKFFAPNCFANEGANATMEQPSLTVCHATFGNITRAHNKQTSTAKDTTNRTKKIRQIIMGTRLASTCLFFFGLARPNRFKMSTVLKKDIGTNNQKLIVQKILANKIVCLAVFDPYSRWNCALQA